LSSCESVRTQLACDGQRSVLGKFIGQHLQIQMSAFSFKWRSGFSFSCAQLNEPIESIDRSANRPELPYDDQSYRTRSACIGLRSVNSSAARFCERLPIASGNAAALLV
jgi:hypothetical protein